jgi:F420-non-reducing hydrogenase iron-sulfur subunit
MKKQQFKPKLTCFYCINAFHEAPETASSVKTAEIQFVKLACSSMVKDIYLLRAFEAGADGVVLIVCPIDLCRYTKGSIRAFKRVEWLKRLLDDIGLDGNRLVISDASNSRLKNPAQFFLEVAAEMMRLGPNPANPARFKTDQPEN